MWILGSQNWGAEVVNSVPAGVQDLGSQTRNNRVGIALAAIAAILSVLLVMVGKIGRWVVIALYALSGCAFAAVSAAESDAGSLRWLGLVLGLLAAGVSVYIGLTSGNWTARNKYDRDARTSSDEPDAVSDWDALSRGEDPSDD